MQRLIEANAAAGGADPMQPERKIATALFADLVGYTALSEKLEPATLARVLNGYFQRMSDAIHEHRGHVSTFLGDGILAYFGALRPDPWQCGDAVAAALAMRDAIADYNRELAREGLPPVGVGIGIHRGPGLAGLIGSRERMEFGFVGSTVNIAARVQGLTRVHGVDILVTEDVRGRARRRVRASRRCRPSMSRASPSPSPPTPCADAPRSSAPPLRPEPPRRPRAPPACARAPSGSACGCGSTSA